MKDDEREELIENVRTLATNIRTFARDIEEGRAKPPEISDFINDYIYDAMISDLAHLKLATVDDAEHAPNDALRERVNPLLAPIGADIDQVYADARKGRVFVVKALWEKMKEAPEIPKEATEAYDTLHYSLQFLGLKPGSPEALALLETTTEEFTQIDQTFGKASAYETIIGNQMMMGLTIQKLKDKHEGKGVKGLPDFARDFQQRFESGIASVTGDLKRIMAQSGLREEELQFYINSRLQIDGYPTDEPPQKYLF